MPTFIVINELSEDYKIQLLELYQHEWWSVGRTKEDVERILVGSSFIVAIIDEDAKKLVAFSRILVTFLNFPMFMMLSLSSNIEV